MTDKAKIQKKKRQRDKKTERQKDRKAEKDGEAMQNDTSPNPSGGQDDRENLLYASNTMRREEFYSHESEIYFQKLKMHVEKCSCPKVNVG